MLVLLIGFGFTSCTSTSLETDENTTEVLATSGEADVKEKPDDDD